MAGVFYCKHCGGVWHAGYTHVCPTELPPWAPFLAQLQERLEIGAREYPAAEKTPTGRIIEEWQQEALDIAGWGYVLWQRIEKLKENILREQKTD